VDTTGGPGLSRGLTLAACEASGRASARLANVSAGKIVVRVILELFIYGSSLLLPSLARL
jgi:hypothetical protein